MKQKTIRFYDDSKADNEAYEKLNKFRDYGFNNAREFVVEAINCYGRKSNYGSAIELDTEELVERIVSRLKDECNVEECNKDRSVKEPDVLGLEMIMSLSEGL